METSSFTANCVKFAQFANHHSESREIRAILASFYHSLLFKCNPTFYSKSRKIRPIRYDINQIRTNFYYSSICLLDTRKTGSNTLLARITRISHLKLEFVKSSLSYSLDNILTFVRFVTEQSHSISKPQFTNVPQYWREKKLILILQTC